ncbi:hypothetical protein CI266_005049 [Salmonella enterica subsp. enterica serovar Kotte]|nr:hypothetical protein [Salmonella enterica subsp. enterica serovar Kotte]
MKILLSLLFIFSFHSYASECDFNETLLASCDFSGDGRTAVFCASNYKNESRYFLRNTDVTEFEVKFNDGNKLKRWLDLGTYTTYLGFNKGRYSYVLGVPEEKPDVVAFLDIKKNGRVISTKKCSSNSFGEKNFKNNSIDDVLDRVVRDNGFKFP